MKQEEQRWTFWRQQARMSEFSGMVQVVALVFVATSLAVVATAACYAAPAVYLIDGIARIYERVLSW